MKNFKIVAFSIFLMILSCDSKKKQKQSKKTTIPFYTEATFSPIWSKPGTKEVENLHQISAFSLTNQDGEIITENTFKNKIYVTDFFFTSCPGICPKMTKNLNAIQEAFKDDDDVLLLSHSVTPEKDSVSVLKDYAKSHGVISRKWHLATGNKKEIYNLGRKSYFIEEDLGLTKGEDEFIHTENFILIDKNKYIRGIYNGLDKNSIKQLIADIRTLKKEK